MPRCQGKLNTGLRCGRIVPENIVFCDTCNSTVPYDEAIAIGNSRQDRLTRYFGHKFNQLIEDKDNLSKFEIDNALFIEREKELIERVKEGDSVNFRKELISLCKNLHNEIKRLSDDEDVGPHAARLVKLFNALYEHVFNGVDHDDAWAVLLTNTERRVKIATAAIQTRAKETQTLTLRDVILIMGRMIDIVYAEAGDKYAQRIAGRIEREIINTGSSLAAGEIEQAKVKS